MRRNTKIKLLAGLGLFVALALLVGQRGERGQIQAPRRSKIGGMRRLAVVAPLITFSVLLICAIGVVIAHSMRVIELPVGDWDPVFDDVGHSLVSGVALVFLLSILNAVKRALNRNDQ